MDLNWTVQPEIALSYRLDNGAFLRLTYRELGSSGTKNSISGVAAAAYPTFFTAFDAGIPTTGFFADPTVPLQREVHGRLEENWLDFDFVSADHDLGTALEWRWSIGLRLASLFQDFHVQDNFPFEVHSIFNPVMPSFTFAPILSLPIEVRQQLSNQSYGIGGHLGFEAVWALQRPDLWLFGRADGGVLGSTNRQHFSMAATVTSASGGGPALVTPDFAAGANGPGVIPTVGAQAGLMWHRGYRFGGLSLFAGYEFGGWWFIATGANASKQALFKHIDTLSHGPFLGCEFSF